MSNKAIKTRIQNKHDLEVNWLLAENFIPLQGELIVYDIEVDKEGQVLTKTVGDNAILLLPAGRVEPYTYERFKIGDGIHAVNELPFVADLSDYALKGELPTKTSQLENDSNFITSIPAEYITESELDKKGYITEHQDISHLAQKTSIPTKLSQLTNDSNYLTAIPGEYITEAELVAKGYLTEHQSLAGLATESFVAAEIAKAKLEGEEVDLSGYATKDDIKNFITEIPSEYITETELDAKGYLTQHQDLSGKADADHKHDDLYDAKGAADDALESAKLYADSAATAVKDALLNGAGDAYDTLKDLGELIDDNTDAISALRELAADKADKEHTHSEYLTEHQSLADYAKKTDIPDVSRFITEVPAEYVTETELTAKGYITEHQSLADYAKKTDIPDVSNFISKIPEEYITESELTAKGYLTAHQDISHLAPKTSIPTKVSQLTNDSNFLTAIPDEYVTDAELEAKGYLTNHQDISHLATKESIPTKVSQLANDSAYLSSIPSEYITESELNAKGYLTQHQSLAGLATESYVDTTVQETIDNLISCGTADPTSAITSQFYFKYATE